MRNLRRTRNARHRTRAIRPTDRTIVALALVLAVVSACSNEPQRSLLTYPVLDVDVQDGATFIADRSWGTGRAISAASEGGLTAIVTTADVYIADSGAEVRRVAAYGGTAADVDIEVDASGRRLVIGQADQVWTIDVSTGETREFSVGPSAAVSDVLTTSGRTLVAATNGLFAVEPEGLVALYDGIVPAGAVAATTSLVVVPVSNSSDIVVDDGATPRRVALTLADAEVVTDASMSVGGVLAVASSPAGDPFESDDRINVVNPATGEVRSAISAVGPLQATSWTALDDHVVIVDSGSFRAWTLDGLQLVDVPMTIDVPVVATHQVSGGVLVVHSDGTMVRWSSETWEPEIIGEGGTTQVDVDVSSDGSTVTTVDYYGGVAWRSGVDGRTLDQDARFAVGETTDVAFSVDGRLAFSSSTGNATVLDEGFDEIQTLRVASGRRTVGAIAFDPDGSVLVTGVAERVGDIAYDDTVVAWEGANEVFRRDGDEADVAGCGFYNSRISFSDDGRWMAVSSHDFAVDVYDASTRQLVASVEGPASILDLSFLPGSGRLAIAYDDATVTLRDGDDFAEVGAFETPMGGYQAMTPLGESGLMAVADVVGDVSIVRSSDGAPVESLGSTGTRLSTLASSDDGSLVAAPDAVGGIIVWSTAEASQIASLSGHTAAVTGLAFAPNGRTLASASRDGTVRTWVLETV